MNPKGLLLINLGTPDAPRPPEVKQYLEEFLMDPYVVDIPAPLRWLLVHGMILRTRPAKSAEAYEKVWTERGSPLLFHHLDLTDGMRKVLHEREPGGWIVVPAMRYGNPSIEAGVQELAKSGIREALVVPLYPQYSLAATESSVVETRRAAAKHAPEIKLQFFPAFYDAEPFLDSFARLAERELEDYDYDHLLFSFHGLPERQVRKTDPTGRHCLANRSCCDRIVEANARCYRAQCFATARALAKRMRLQDGRYSISFQSRLGRSKWIEPYTDVLYQELTERGIRRLAVICPAFVADCLETLEEIRIRGKEDFIARGGEDLRLVASLNAEPFWISALAEMVRSVDFDYTQKSATEQ